jgi:hypothetical protein
MKTYLLSEKKKLSIRFSRLSCQTPLAIILPIHSVLAVYVLGHDNRNEVDALTAEVEEAQAALARQTAQRDVLSAHALSLSHRQSLLQQQCVAAEQLRRQARDASERTSDRVDTALAGTVQCIQELMAGITLNPDDKAILMPVPTPHTISTSIATAGRPLPGLEAGASSQGTLPSAAITTLTASPALFSHVSLDAYLAADALFSKELERYDTKQFRQGMC